MLYCSHLESVWASNDITTGWVRIQVMRKRPKVSSSSDFLFNVNRSTEFRQQPRNCSQGTRKNLIANCQLDQRCCHGSPCKRIENPDLLGVPTPISSSSTYWGHAPRTFTKVNIWNQFLLFFLFVWNCFAAATRFLYLWVHFFLFEC